MYIMNFSFFKKQTIKILILFLLGFSLFTLFRTFSRRNYYENFVPLPEIVDDLLMNKEDAFCESHRGKSLDLEESCGKLSHKKCNSLSCCIWKSGEDKCVAGNESGPLFNTDSFGKTTATDYHHKGVFYKKG